MSELVWRYTAVAIGAGILGLLVGMCLGYSWGYDQADTMHKWNNAVARGEVEPIPEDQIPGIPTAWKVTCVIIAMVYLCYTFYGIWMDCPGPMDNCHTMTGFWN